VPGRPIPTDFAPSLPTIAGRLLVTRIEIAYNPQVGSDAFGARRRPAVRAIRNQHYGEETGMNFSFSDFFTFDKMVTPTIIQIIYYILIVLVVLMGLFGIFGAMMGGGIPAFIGGLMMLVLGPIGVRIWCELVILGFNVYKVLCEIRDQRSA
jgi:hypothetical protein